MHKRILIFSITTLSALLLCSCAEASKRYQAPVAGFDNVKGWNSVQVTYLGSNEGVAWSIDPDGEVGHPLYVSSPTANCTNASGQSASWTMDSSIISGSLPPGITLNSSSFDIEGIPTERGHWIVELNSGGLTCDGKGYLGFKQELRFHITGTGKVVQ